jgi:hypothetical protein
MFHARAFRALPFPVPFFRRKSLNSRGNALAICPFRHIGRTQARYETGGLALASEQKAVSQSHAQSLKHWREPRLHQPFENRMTGGMSQSCPSPIRRDLLPCFQCINLERALAESYLHGQSIVPLQCLHNNTAEKCAEWCSACLQRIFFEPLTQWRYTGSRDVFADLARGHRTTPTGVPTLTLY